MQCRCGTSNQTGLPTASEENIERNLAYEAMGLGHAKARLFRLKGHPSNLFFQPTLRIFRIYLHREGEHEVELINSTAQCKKHSKSISATVHKRPDYNHIVTQQSRPIRRLYAPPIAPTHVLNP